MTLSLIMLPLLNYFLFLLFARTVKCSVLAVYATTTMAFTVFYLFALSADIVNGNVFIATLGNWISSELFEIN